MTSINRRDFLKLSALSLGSLAFRGMRGISPDLKTVDVGRIAIQSVSVYSEPDDKSRIVMQRYRDELINIYEDVISDKGPGYNPLWYRVWRGYIHAAHVVKVRTILNSVESSVPKTGLLTEVTVPYSLSYRFTKKFGWDPNYRLYYGSTHWIVGVEEGPDGSPWYRIRDELLSADEQNYFAPAEHFRLISPLEYTPIVTDVPPEQKRIEVNLATQTLIAFENDKEVLKTTISSGVPSNGRKGVNTDTPRGDFNVYSKLPSKHMGEGYFTNDLDAYILPGVPWVTFFEKSGVGFHGTWWHNNYGMTMSHGCINMKTPEALWIFRWTTPAAEPNKVETRGNGTRVIVY